VRHFTILPLPLDLQIDNRSEALTLKHYFPAVIFSARPMTQLPPAKKEFSNEERAAVRSVLIAYAAEHGIGAPNLQQRIAKAAGRDAHLLPLKTLQRFLADKGRTNDALVSLCFQFVQSLPGGAATGTLATVAAMFFGPPPTSSGALAGSWNGLAQPHPSGMVVIADGGHDISSVQSSQLKIGTALGSPVLTTAETVTNPSAPRTSRTDPGFRHSYEGIALEYPPLLCIISKNLLTRLPRSYWLQMNDAGFLFGHGAEAVFVTGKTKRVVSELTSFRFERLPEET
jgi:hypothetical protein